LIVGVLLARLRAVAARRDGARIEGVYDRADRIRRDRAARRRR